MDAMETKENIDGKKKIVNIIVCVLVFVFLQVFLAGSLHYLKQVQGIDMGMTQFIRALIILIYVVSMVFTFYGIEDKILMKRIAINTKNIRIYLMDLVCILLIGLFILDFVFLRIEGIAEDYLARKIQLNLVSWESVKLTAMIAGVVTLLNSHRSKTKLAQDGKRMIYIIVGFFLGFMVLLWFLGTYVLFI